MKPRVRESVIERRVVEWAAREGVLTVKNRGTRGFPDRTFFYNGRTTHVEFKRPGGKLSTLQERWIDRLLEQRISVVVSYDDAGCIAELSAVLGIRGGRDARRRAA